MKDEVDNDEDEVAPKKPRMDDNVPSARVVGIVKRNWRQYCGMILQPAVKGLL